MRAVLFFVVLVALTAAATAAGTDAAAGGSTAGDSAAETCVADAASLCLNEDRFRVAVRWETEDRSGDGRAVEITDDTGYFWFFSEHNVEVVVKVLDGCAIGDGAYWVFVGGLTDVRVELEVEDMESGESKTYENEAGNLFAPVIDTSAFPTCD